MKKLFIRYYIFRLENLLKRLEKHIETQNTMDLLERECFYFCRNTYKYIFLRNKILRDLHEFRTTDIPSVWFNHNKEREDALRAVILVNKLKLK